MILIGIVTTLAATEPEKSAAAESAHARENALERVIEAAVGAFSEFLSRDMAFVALAFVVLFKFTDALSGSMTSPFVIDLGFSRNEYAAIIKGVGLAATLVGGFAGGFVARAYSLPTSLLLAGVLQAVANLAFSWQAIVGLNAALAHLRDHCREFHQCHRNGDLRCLSFSALPQSVPYGDPIRAFDRAGGFRTHLSVVRSGLYRGCDRLGLVFCDLCAGRFAGACLAGLVAQAPPFRRPGAGWSSSSMAGCLPICRGAGVPHLRHNVA